MTNKTILFDVDDTLLVTPAIFDIRRGDETKTITTAEYRNMSTAGETHGWEIDYSAFSDPDKVWKSIMAAELGPAIPWLKLLLKHDIHRTTALGVLTNRSGDETHLAGALQVFLKEKANITWNVEPHSVICTNNPKYGFPPSVSGSAQKLKFIQDLYNNGWGEITLIDDDRRHIDLVNRWVAIEAVKGVDTIHVSR